jgi:dedicator of cytokinesis protein 1
MTEILTNFHRKLHMAGLTEAQKNEFRTSAVAKIEEGRRLLGMDMVVRTNAGEPANETNTPLVELYKMHRKATVALASNKSAIPRLGSAARVARTGSTANLNATSELPPFKHLCLNVKSFVCAVGEDTELKFFLYQQSKQLVISETFVVNLTARGLPVDPKLANNMVTVYRDIHPLIPLGDLLLVCRIFRRGGMQPKKDGAKPLKPTEKPPELRRPFGVAIQNIGHAGIKRGREVEQTMPIYQCKDEAMFWNMPALINDMAMKDIEVAPKSTGIIVGLNMFTGGFKDTIARDLTYRNCPVTLSQELSTDDPLTGVRHDLYLTLQSAELSKARAVEISVSVRDAQAKIIDRAIFVGQSHSPFPQGVVRSFILESTAAPRWDESFCLKIPAAQVLPGLHVFFQFKNVGKDGKDDYFGYTKLDLTSPEGTMIKDGAQSLGLFTEGKGVQMSSEPNWYLKEKPSDSSKAKVVAKKDIMKVHTKLVSNQFTQNPYLHSLFNWKVVQPAKLIDALGKMTFAAPEEIIKFIRFIFDSCFMVLDAKVPNAPPHVFTALVYVIGTLVDERTGRAGFRLILDEYLQNHFRSVTTLEHFITALVQYFSQYESKKSSELINTLKALEYIIKFIIQSAVLYAQIGGDPTPYKQQMLVFFQQVNSLLRNNKPQFVGAITMAVKKVAPLFPQLLRLFAPSELASITIDFISAIPYSEQQKSLNAEKLLLFQDLMGSALFQDAEAGRALLQTIVYHVQNHLQSKAEEEVGSCIEVLLKIVDMIQRLQTTSPDFVGFVTPLLPTVMKYVLDNAGTPSNDPNRPPGPGQDPAMPSQKVSDMSMILLSLFFLMQPTDFTNYFGSLQDYAQQKEFLGSTTDLLGRVASRRLATFPENWFVMLMFQYSVSLKVTIILASFMQERLSIIDHEPELWSTFFSLLVDFVGARILELESFTETKRKLVLQSYGDMRMDILQVLQVMWTGLDQWQYHFLKQLMRPFIKLSALEQPQLSQAGADLYVTLVQRELTATGGLKITENITIGTLEEMFQSIVDRAKENTKGLEEEEAYVSGFFTNLYATKLTGAATEKFLRDMTAWLERLYELRTIPDESGFEDDRTDATLKLMDWLRGINRMDLYKKYAHQLSQSHASANNFAEAGMAVLLHAQQHQWHGPVTEEALGPDFPAQTQGQRRMALYKLAMEYLEKGKMWEKCIALVKEMRDQGLYPAADQDIAKFENMITTQERFFCEYFRVGYYGRGFPATVRNKEFIYRGFELERLADFTQRINQKFPQAKILNFTDPPGDDVLQAETQSLQIFSVKPSSLEEKDGRPNPRLEAAERAAGGRQLPASTRKYWASNEVPVFSYSKPFRKNKRKDEKPHEEFADLWYKNFFYVTSDALPAVNRRVEIVKIDSTETHPIDNAVNAISEKNREIVAMTTKYEGGQGGAQLGPFTMILKGVIDAAVSGGTVLYQKAFFCDEWLGVNPDKVQKAEDLNQALIDQLGFLDKGLKVHAQLCPQEMALLQQDLDMRMINVKREVKNSLQSTQDLFRRHGGSGNVRLGDLDLSNVDAAPAPAASPMSFAPGGAAPGSPSAARMTYGGLPGGPGGPGTLPSGASSPRFGVPMPGTPGNMPGSMPGMTRPGMPPPSGMPPGAGGAGLVRTASMGPLGAPPGAGASANAGYPGNPGVPGSFQPAGNPGGYQPPGNPGGYQPTGNPGSYQPPGNPGGYQPSANPGGYQPSGNPGGYQPSGNPGTPGQFQPGGNPTGPTDGRASMSSPMAVGPLGARPGPLGGPSPLGTSPASPRPMGALGPIGGPSPLGGPSGAASPRPLGAPGPIGGPSPLGANPVASPLGAGPRPVGMASPTPLGAGPGPAGPRPIGGPNPTPLGGPPGASPSPLGSRPSFSGNPLGAPPQSPQPVGAPNSNYGAMPPPKVPAPAPGAGTPSGPPNSNYGSLPPSNPNARPVGMPAASPLGRPPGASPSGPQSNYASFGSPPAGSPNVMTAPAGSPAKFGGAGMPGPSGYGNPAPGAAGMPGPSGYGNPSAPGGAPPATYGNISNLPPAGSNPNVMTAPAGGGGPQGNYASFGALGSSPNVMTAPSSSFSAPGKMPAPAPSAGGPATQNYGSIPPVGGPARPGLGSTSAGMPPARPIGMSTGPLGAPPGQVGGPQSNYGALPAAGGSGYPAYGANPAPNGGYNAGAPQYGGNPNPAANGGYNAGAPQYGANPNPAANGGYNGGPPQSNYGSLPPAASKYPPGGY